MPDRNDRLICLAGTQDCAVDDKRRFSLPPKFRDAFPPFAAYKAGQSHPAYLGPWFRHTLAIFPIPAWERLTRGVMKLDYTTAAVDAHKSGILGQYEPVNTDPEGRLTLTPSQCEWIGLAPGKKGRVMVVGDGGICRVWEMSAYEAAHRALDIEGGLRALTDEIRKVDPDALTFSSSIPLPTEGSAGDENEEPGKS